MATIYKGEIDLNLLKVKVLCVFICLFAVAPSITEAHNGTTDELGGHFRNADCVYLLHNPTSLGQSAQNVGELIQLILQNNGNEKCKNGLNADKIDLEGYTFNGDLRSYQTSKETSNQPAIAVNQKELTIGEKYSATLVKCTDGDTAQFNVNGTIYKTRFLYIDTPESTNRVEPYGKEASEYTCNALKQGVIQLETDGSNLFDKYDRLLAWVWIDGKLHQEEITKAGLVKKFYDYGDYQYEELMISAMSYAKANYLGIYEENRTEEQVNYEVSNPTQANEDTSNQRIESSEEKQQIVTNEKLMEQNDKSGTWIILISLITVILFFLFSKFLKTSRKST
jgi:micrococcal nuclease